MVANRLKCIAFALMWGIVFAFTMGISQASIADGDVDGDEELMLRELAAKPRA